MKDASAGTRATPDADRAAPRVALVNMPCASTQYPSIQLGLLKAGLARHGITADTYYFNLDFAARIGWNIYERLAVGAAPLTGEWLFARAAFGDDAPDAARFLTLCGDDLGPFKGFPTFLLELRERGAPAFIEQCLARVPWGTYDVVGFGSIFEQNCAALALARRIKEEHPAVITVFGGSNFEDEMGLEYVRALPWIDYAVLGEGDEVFPAMLQRLAAGDDVAGMPGVACRRGGQVWYAGRAPMVRDLDDLPTPDYDDFFAAARATGRPPDRDGYTLQIPFESARGCWWGAKHHCTFCGLNGSTMAYRSKTPARLIAEVDELARRHGVVAFSAVDNILDHRYVDEVFGTLAERRDRYRFFYEVKANLTQAQLRTLALGGVRGVQPGIESLSTRVLQLMRKGTTALLNVRFLKWAHYYDFDTVWNILVGFPGERSEDYDRQLAIIEAIRHLPPMTQCVRVRVDRFSPYFDQPEQFGIDNVRPQPAYACIYPATLDIARIAYHFDHEAADTPPHELDVPLVKAIAGWRAAWAETRTPSLYYRRVADGQLVVEDGRDPEAVQVHHFSPAAAEAHEFCGPTAHRASRIAAHLRELGLESGLGTVQRDLDTFVALRLMLEEDGQYLSLALPDDPDWQPSRRGDEQAERSHERDQARPFSIVLGR